MTPAKTSARSVRWNRSCAVGSLVQRSVDGLAFLLEARPGLDLAGYAEELVETFDIATRR
jgi:hypothetical protein